MFSSIITPVLYNPHDHTCSSYFLVVDISSLSRGLYRRYWWKVCRRTKVGPWQLTSDLHKCDCANCGARRTATKVWSGCGCGRWCCSAHTGNEVSSFVGSMAEQPWKHFGLVEAVWILWYCQHLIGNGGPRGTGWCWCGCGQAPPFWPFENIKMNPSDFRSHTPVTQVII